LRKHGKVAEHWRKARLNLSFYGESGLLQQTRGGSKRVVDDFVDAKVAQWMQLVRFCCRGERQHLIYEVS
jgi:hypothetical protein